MFRSILTLGLVLGLSFVATAGESARPSASAAQAQLLGKVTKYEAGKLITVEADGKSATFKITQRTKISGTVAVGSLVGITPGDDPRNALEIEVKQ